MESGGGVWSRPRQGCVYGFWHVRSRRIRRMRASGELVSQLPASQVLRNARVDTHAALTEPLKWG